MCSRTQLIRVSPLNMANDHVFSKNEVHFRHDILRFLFCREHEESHDTARLNPS